MLDLKILRSLWAMLLLSTALISTHAVAQSPPPDMPLPPCVEVDGEQQGACRDTSPDVTGTASGPFGEGSQVTITTVPTPDVCISHVGYPPYPWDPSPCYSAVRSPGGGTLCAVINLHDGETFREMPCLDALYQSPPEMASALISWEGTDGSQCGAAGNFQTYAYGGPASVPGATWSEFGPAELECVGTFNGPRPDGLLGPTWILISVGIDLAQNGDVRRGYSRSSMIYVPVDGDLRDTVDVEVLATSAVEGSGDHLTVTYTASLTNKGTKEAEGIEVLIPIPAHVHVESVSDGRCEIPAAFVGGTIACTGLTLAGGGHALGDDVEFIDVVGRIVNAAEFDGLVEITATVTDDIDTSNNTDATHAEIELRAGGITETRQYMEAMAPYFDYETRDELLKQQCNVYMDDIFDRLEAIHAQAPEVFENLSYGKVTSGDYYWAPIENNATRAGHVGVVVYAKGTDYRQSGIIIHGTPTWSPTDLDLESQLGRQAPGEHVTTGGVTVTTVLQGTQSHGDYYRTPVHKFPGSPAPEGVIGCGFEGAYPDNQDEFRTAVPNACRHEAPPPACPYYPNATIVRTESPVDILASNSQGQRVETRDGEIYLQELDSGIHSFATPHEDGTFGWTLVLPPDDYDIDLLGTGEGPYKLTLTTFDANGEPVETVYEGTTQSGQVDEYVLAGTPVPPPGGGDDGAGGAGNGVGNAPRRSGGGSFGLLGLLGLLLLASGCVGALRSPRKTMH